PPAGRRARGAASQGARRGAPPPRGDRQGLDRAEAAALRGPAVGDHRREPAAPQALIPVQAMKSSSSPSVCLISGSSAVGGAGAAGGARSAGLYAQPGGTSSGALPVPRRSAKRRGCAHALSTSGVETEKLGSAGERGVRSGTGLPGRSGNTLDRTLAAFFMTSRG